MEMLGRNLRRMKALTLTVTLTGKGG
jgi:hypothetical protein